MHCSVFTQVYIPKFLLSVLIRQSDNIFKKLIKVYQCVSQQNKNCVVANPHFIVCWLKIYHQLSMAQMNYKFVNVLNFTNRCNKPVSLAVPRNHRLGN